VLEPLVWVFASSTPFFCAQNQDWGPVHGAAAKCPHAR